MSIYFHLIVTKLANILNNNKKKFLILSIFGKAKLIIIEISQIGIFTFFSILVFLNLLIENTMRTSIFTLSLMLIISLSVWGQKKKNDKENIIEQTANGLKFRSIGPAFTSGRIADFAVNPDNPAEYYVGAASGHIWKTTDNGFTFQPVFEHYGAYSIGCLAMDPHNHNIVWAGTGENNHQRAIGYGNGIYKTVDGGKSWKNMGLQKSFQIGMINIDPRDSNTVLAAAEGSIWGSGGDRGLYKTTDGGKTWKRVLYISENTGVNNVVRDLQNPDILYATSEQRRRRTQTHISGGPESKVYKSEDAGETWREIMKGLPKVDIGGMGIAVSPVDSNVVYLIMEAAEGKSGFFRSTDQGESWQKMSDYHSSGQYYNEIYCDPADVDKVYSPQTHTSYTEDGGKTWKRLNVNNKHVDDHALWINPHNPKHFIIGGDGGIYVTYNTGKTFRKISTLPVVQFYRVYLDNNKPFYNIYGGTQDNNSIGGPSRNIRADGINKGDWITTIGGDGFGGAVDPENPNIVYSEYQYGNIFRFDKKSKQRLKIKPMPGKNELTYRWNWNTPFIISPHNHKRLYIAAERLFRSDDRGDSWQIVSPDLTAQIDRNTWKVMGKYWPAEAVRKDVSTSLYNTLVSLDESPVKEGLIYTGSDDGVVQVTEDSGKHWRKIDKFPGVPDYTYVSDIFADRFDKNTVYVTFDNRKHNDFKPYILKSTDLGHTWKNITANLPENGSVHTIAQDYKNKNLLFTGTEFGFYFSIDGGKHWNRLNNNLPDIAVRDIALQQRENDLVLATFGRGFYILDDYSPLRQLNEDFLKNKAYLFPVKEALQYVQSHKKYGQGDTEFYAPNPPYGAIFTYYLQEAPMSTTEKRRKKEKEQFKKAEKIRQATWEELHDEKLEEKSYLLFSITDKEGNIIKKLTAKPEKGIHRVTWNLNYHNPHPVDNNLEKFDALQQQNFGIPVLPGTYYVKMGLYDKGVYQDLTQAVAFEVKRLKNRSLPEISHEEYQNYFTGLQNTLKQVTRLTNSLEQAKNDLYKIKQTLLRSPVEVPGMMTKVQKTEKQIYDLEFDVYGVEPIASYEEIPPHKLPLYIRFMNIMWRHLESTAPITLTEKQQLSIVREELKPALEKLKNIRQQLKAYTSQLKEAGAPWTPGE